jgi:hypothetical protein
MANKKADKVVKIAKTVDCPESCDKCVTDRQYHTEKGYTLVRCKVCGSEVAPNEEEINQLAIYNKNV